MRFLFLYVQGFAVRAMLFRNIKKPFGKTSLFSHAFSVLHTHESFARFGQKSSRQKNTVCKRTTLADRCSFFIRLSRRKAAFFRRCAFSVRLNCNHRIGANVLNIEHSLVIGFAR